MTPRRDRQAYDDMVRHAAHAATDVGFAERHTWLRSLSRPVDWGDIAMAVLAVAAWSVCIALVAKELAR
jgi:hypothetical protein